MTIFGSCGGAARTWGEARPTSSLGRTSTLATRSWDWSTSPSLELGVAKAGGGLGWGWPGLGVARAGQLRRSLQTVPLHASIPSPIERHQPRRHHGPIISGRAAAAGAPGILTAGRGLLPVALSFSPALSLSPSQTSSSCGRHSNRVHGCVKRSQAKPAGLLVSARSHCRLRWSASTAEASPSPCQTSTCAIEPGQGCAHARACAGRLRPGREAPRAWRARAHRVKQANRSVGWFTPFHSHSRVCTHVEHLALGAHLPCPARGQSLPGRQVQHLPSHGAHRPHRSRG